MLASATARAQHVNTTTASGERVVYDAYYNWQFIWLNAARVSFSVSDTVVNSVKRLKLESVGNTRSGYDFIYHVSDTFQTVTNASSLMPIAFYQRNYEGKRIIENDWLYHYDSLRITGHSRIGSTKKTHESTINAKWNADSYDVLSMVYIARNLNYDTCHVGSKIPINLLINARKSNVFIRFLGRETIKLRSGRKFRCIKFSPKLSSGTIFKDGEDMVVWITDDRNRMPVAVEAKVVVGSVKAQMSSVTGLRWPLDAEVK